MNLKLIDNNIGLLRLKKYFKCYLRGKIDYHHIHPKTGQVLFKSKIHFHNLNTYESIYFFQHDENIYFGLGREISDIVNMNSVTKLSTTLDYKLEINNSLMFAQDEFDKFYFIFPICYDSLSDKEIFSLKERHDIVIIDDQEYVNFGEIRRGIDILRNIRNFMLNVVVDLTFNSTLQLIYVRVSNIYANDSRFCKSCGNLISKSFNKNNLISKVVNKDQRFCADCFAQRFMDYFLSSFPKEFRKKQNLQCLAKDDKVIKFYLELFNHYDVFDKNAYLPKDLGNFHFKPKKMQLNLNKYNKLLRTLKVLNEITRISDNDKLSPFEKRLFENNLSCNEGRKIINKLELDVFSGSLIYYKYTSALRKRIESRIDEYINEYGSQESIDIFKMVMALNKYTLDINGNLKEDFFNHIQFYNLNEDFGWEIRDHLIDKINEGLINEIDIESQFKEIIQANILSELDNIFMKKEYYVNYDNVHILAIFNKMYMKKFVNSLNLIKMYLNIDNFTLFQLKYDFFKIIMDVTVDEEGLNNIKSILNDYSFKEFSLNKSGD